ncbi:phage protease [Nitrosomonas sp. Nm166]|uniref:phage protease n=1 Tax=Nitrosomonas sp. Nm166 TaxID=1881054 RepID=UPI0015A6AF21|nr:phage protease [Nitrosomonas sp. Nm166]
MNPKNTQFKKNSSGIAACAIIVTPGKEIQLFPEGRFRASDGRPKDAPHWKIDAELAASIIADFSARENRTVIDYEHQTLLTAQNGQPAPASGWFSKLEWRDSGLYAIDVEWTERATTMIESGEYKYISPVFTYDKKTGAIKSILNAALTNNPALDGMDAVAASQFAQLINQQNDQEKLSMEELLNNLRWMLNMPVTTTQEEIVAELQKAIDQIKTSATAATSAAGFNVANLIKSQADQIASLSLAVNNPDPARFVAVATMKAIQDELTALKKKELEREVGQVIQEALTSSKLLPPQVDWARSHGMKDLESLKQFIADQPPVAALTQTQTGGNPPEGIQSVDTQDSKAIAEAALKYQTEKASAGITVTTAQAVDAVLARK